MSTSSNIVRWWDRKQAKGDSVADALWTRADTRASNRRIHELRDLIHEAIYFGRPLAPKGRELTSLMSSTTKASAPATINVTQSKIDAITSRMAKHRTFPVLGCDDASHTETRHAETASRYIRGKLSSTQVQREKPLTIRDTLICGTGVMGVSSSGVDVNVSRIMRHEIVVGERDGKYGTPRQMMRIYSMSLEEAIAKWPEHQRALEASATPSDASESMLSGSYAFEPDVERVNLVTAWHLPSGPDAHDGRTTTAIRGKVLEDREWKRCRFPMAFLHWVPPTKGFWGQGLVEILSGIQSKINDICRDIQEALYHASSLTIFLQRGSNVNKEHLRGRWPKVVETDGPPPQYIAPNPVSQQQFQFLERLLSLADDLSGLARDYSSGTTQLGANASGRAVQMLDDIQSDRFMMFQLQDSAFMIDLGAIILDEAREIAETSKATAAPWIKDFKWGRVNLDDGTYALQFEPENFLPKTRGGRLAAANELGATGLVTDKTTLISMFNEPDMQRVFRNILGPKNNIARVISALYDKSADIYELVPGPYFPIEEGIKEVQNEYNHSEAKGAEEWLLKRFDSWLQLAKEQSKKRAKGEAEAAAEAAPPPMPGMPGEMPMDPMAAMGAPPMMGSPDMAAMQPAPPV